MSAPVWRTVEWAERWEHGLGSVGAFDRWPGRLLARVPVGPTDVVLDVCCGTGIVARHVAPLARRVIAVDSSPGMVEVGRRVVGDAVDWRVGDALALPLDDESVDVVLCSHGLQHVGDRAAALPEWRRVLRPDGRVGVVQWADPETTAPYQWTMLTASAAVGFENPFRFGEPVAELGNPDALRQLAADAGLRDVRLFLETVTAAPVTLEAVTARLLSGAMAGEWQAASESTRSRWWQLVEEGLAPFRDGSGGYAIPYTSYILTAVR